MNKHEEVGIKYRKQKLGRDLFLLIPEETICGYSVFPIFYSIEEHRMIESKEDVESNDYLVDSVFNIKDLCEIYDFDDSEFILSYYFEEEKDYAIIVNTSDAKIRKKKVKIDMFRSNDIEETYQMMESAPSIVLNESALRELLNSEDFDKVRKELKRLQSSLKAFKEKSDNDSLTKVSIQNGHITEINIDKNIVGIDHQPVEQVQINQNNSEFDPKTISVSGLEKYINERVFGHPEEVRKIATTLIMNLRATKEDGTESILIPGPTGTGKTATIEAASEYLGLPFKIVDTSNLVTQGIKGTSIEDELMSLYSKAGGNIALAEKGIIAFDEFDKLSQSDLDIKGPIKNILLKFIEGSTFKIERLKGDIEISTRQLSKIFLGAFEELFEEEKSIGFDCSKDHSSSQREFDINRMYEKRIYSKELISRIPHIIPYYELSDEVKRDIILHSKLSKYLIKKKRYKREFGVELIADESYIEALLSSLKVKDRSMRDLNNLILNSLGNVEYDLLSQEGHVKKLVLTSETVSDPRKYHLS